MAASCQVIGSLGAVMLVMAFTLHEVIDGTGDVFCVNRRWGCADCFRVDTSERARYDIDDIVACVREGVNLHDAHPMHQGPRAGLRRSEGFLVHGGVP
jgi:hypothetical protein